MPEVSGKSGRCRSQLTQSEIREEERRTLSRLLPVTFHLDLNKRRKTEYRGKSKKRTKHSLDRVYGDTNGDSSVYADVL